MVVFLNTGTAPYFDFSKPLVYPIPSVADPGQAEFMAVADLNNDGLNDLVVLNPANVQTEYANRITSYLNATQNPPTEAVTLTYGQQISNGNDIVNVQLPTSNGLGSAPELEPPPDNATLYVRDLYRKILQRDAEPDGLGSWVALLNGGTPRAAIVEAIWDSPEHFGLEVDQLYATYLHRAADAPGRALWVNALLGGASEADVALGLLTSAEYQQSHADTAAYLYGLYGDVLGRTPDPGGLDAWQSAAQGEMSRAALAEAFLHSPEAEQQLMEQYYSDYLGRAGDSAGVAYWLGALQSGQWSPDQVAQVFLASDEFYSRAGTALSSAAS
jgi:hypothetical protein